MKYKTVETVIKETVSNKTPVSTYRRICETIRNMYEQRSKIEKHEGDQLAVGTYFTKNFEMSPKAQLLYSDLPKETDPSIAEKSAILQDKLFALEKQSQAKESASQQDVDSAEGYVKQIKMFAKKMGLEKEHSYIDSNLNNIKKFAKNYMEPVVDSDSEVEIAKKKTTTSPPYKRVIDPVKDLDLDSKKFLIRRDLKAQRKIKIIDAD